MTMSKTVAAVAVKLLVGGLQYVVLKVCLDWPSRGLPVDECADRDSLEERHPFGKNFLIGAITFASMLAVILPYFYAECRDFSRSRQLSGLPPKHPYSRRAYMLTLTPAVLDVAAVVLSLAANKSIPATTMIILKSMRIIISAFLSKFILHKAQQPYQWMGVLITTLGLIPIFVVDFLRSADEKEAEAAYKKHIGMAEDKDKSSNAIAFVFVIVAELMRAIRYLLEERLMKMESLSAEFVVYMESLVGLVISVAIMFMAHGITAKSVAKNCGRVENLSDTWAMLKNEWVLWVLLTCHFVFVGVSNYATTLVTKYTSSVLNAILSQARTIVVWLPSVILGFVAERESEFTDHNGKYHPGVARFGEPFDKFVPLVFLGFFVVTAGAMVYSGHIRIPGTRCQPEPKKPKTVESPSTSHAVIEHSTSAI
jgi:drug/metabolite transporter (DMT)-like permease